MGSQNLILYQFNSLCHILKELEQDLNFKVVEISNKKNLNDYIENHKNYLIITKQNSLNINNQIIFDNLPIKINKLIEIVNVEFLKLQFNDQSQININNYIINLNSRELSFKDVKLKLTEKEVNTIIYLSKIEKAISIDELQTNVWGYQSETETHTVETHIYRLRKKIFKTFKDNSFIISKKNGYQIK